MLWFARLDDISLGLAEELGESEDVREEDAAKRSIEPPPGVEVPVESVPETLLSKSRKDEVEPAV